jgi:hypothetical protein
MRAERRGFRLYPALLAMGAGVLMSCAAEPPAPAPETAAIRPPPTPSPDRATPLPTAPRPARKPTPPAETPDEAVEMTMPKPAVDAATPEATWRPHDPAPGSTALGSTNTPPPPVSELIGLDQPAATRLFGPAAERSEAPPATVWRYKNGTCELDLFFYLDLRSGRMRTLHYSFKGDGGDTARRQDCLRSLLASRPG